MKKLSLRTILLTGLISICGLTLGACTSKYQQESTGQFIDSSVVTTKVKAKLVADERIPGANITVTTYKNVVQLSGFVNNQFQKNRAEVLAKEVEGVVEVKNALVIKH